MAHCGHHAHQSQSDANACAKGRLFDENKRLRDAMTEACDLLAERKYGSPARSPGHNARLCLEAALTSR